MVMINFTSEQIREIREALGLTQTEFAVKCGVSASTVISWENDLRHPSWPRMQRLNELAAPLGKRLKEILAKEVMS
jgi:transcriptional regulator with XRE-family HTH domain